MSPIPHVVDLAVLVSDKDIEAVLRGILSRPMALGIREISFRIFSHVEHDPGCYQQGHNFLRPMVNSCAHGLVVFDRVGSGQEAHSRREIEHIVKEKLGQSGWGQRAEALVLDPELEAWVWSDSPEVAACLGWKKDSLELRAWLVEQGLWPDGYVKPPDPKLAVERVLRQVNKPRSSAIYEQLGRRVSFQRCADPAFRKFKRILRAWFEN